MTGALLNHLMQVLYTWTYSAPVLNYHPGTCNPVPGVAFGSEDIATLPSGLTFISTGLKSHFNSPVYNSRLDDNNVTGKILLFDFNKPDGGVIELAFDTEFKDEDFRPHGLSVIQNNVTGVITLFVVNHQMTQEAVEKFEFDQEKKLLRHINTYTDPLMEMINDVAADDEDSFYVTSYSYSRQPEGIMFDIFFQRPIGRVVYCSFNNCRSAADGLVLPNGVHFSADKSALYVSNFPRFVNIYKIEADNSLTMTQTVSVQGSPDNFSLDPDSDDVILGTQPSIPELFTYVQDPGAKIAPSRVVSLRMRNSTFSTGLSTLYSDDGNQIPACTVASLYKNAMLVGSITDKLLYCKDINGKN